MTLTPERKRQEVTICTEKRSASYVPQSRRRRRIRGTKRHILILRILANTASVLLAMGIVGT